MSTTQSFPAGPSSTAPPPPHHTGPNASTLLFGFLVSALSMFAIFMTFAVVWNRLIVRRHAIEAMMASSHPAEPPRLRRPVMRDIWIIPDEQSPPWQDVKPVAAQNYDYPRNASRAEQTEQRIPFWRRHLWNRLPPEITYLFYRPVPPEPHTSSDTDASQVELSHGSDIQVSLLIAMPRAAKLTREGEREKSHHVYHEVVFATTNVLYASS